jgi:HK97 family phage major capsid protein
MSLTSNNNVTPHQSLTREDLQKVIEDEVGKVKAEILGEQRAKDLETLSDPDFEAKKAAKMAEVASKANATAGNMRGSNRDSLASKEIGEMTTNERARMFARWIQCAYQARALGGTVEAAADIAKKAGQVTLAKAFQATDFDQGGFLLEPAFADAVIEELLAKVVYTRAGPQDVELPEGGLVMPYEDDGADAQWVGEGVAPNAEEVTGGQLRLQPHKLITIVGVSNDLLRAKPGKSDRFVLNSMLRGMATKLDSTLLRSLGTSSEPMGLRGLVPAANKFDVTSGATITQAVLVREILKLQDIIETLNVDLETDRPNYFGAPRTKNYLKAQRATDGLLFPGLETGNMLLGVPLSNTSNIPINLDESGTAANDESELYCVAMDLMILGRTEDMLVDIQPGAAYQNSAGSTVAAFSRDETPIRVIGKWDHAASQRGNEISMAQEIDWAL